MAQPVYVVPRPGNDLDLLTGLYGVPFFVGWLCVCAVVWDDLTSLHPVFRLLLIGAALATGLLGGLRPMRLLYALAVAVAGMLFIFENAADIIWTIFWGILFLVAWVAIAYNCERELGQGASSSSPTDPSAQNTAPR